MSALSRADIEAVDRRDMLGEVLALPHKLRDALWRAKTAEIARRYLSGGLAACGMGGSAIGGDLAAGVIGDRALRQIRTVRDYLIEPWAGDDVLFLCASYSGETEETLDCFRAAGRARAPRVALTTGGTLARAAPEEHIPIIDVPNGMPPRAAVAYMLVGALACAERCGAAPSLEDEVEGAAPMLDVLAVEWGPDAPGDALPKALARRLFETVPVVYGAGATAPVALRWKAQLNENAKAPAFSGTLPEIDHNEICGWAGAGRLAPFSAVFLDDTGISARVRRRIELTARAVGLEAAGVEVVESRGATSLERVLSLVLLDDLVSVYLATLAGIDPTPVEPIDRLKGELSDLMPNEPRAS